ncbi:MAG: hypothetical protein JNL90_11850 [Planctomycetes bacterium]|nr:hypothetical protein [Planctomycetota bacterium]
MVKTLVISFGAASLAALGYAGTRGGEEGCCAPKGAAAKAAPSECCASEPRPATIECTGSACVVRYTTSDGRDGVIEIACDGDACKVVRCEPACDRGCGPADCPDGGGSGECCSKRD